MKKLRDLLSKIKDLFKNDDNDDHRIHGFRGEVYEDLREELADEITDNFSEVRKLAEIEQKIKLGLKLTNSEQRKSGIIQL